MYNPQWVSQGLHEHPVKYQQGVYGKIVLSQAGIYVLQVGGGIMSCPQEWATKIHHDEITEKEVKK